VADPEITLLVVDDDEPIRIAVCDLLGESGYRAQSAEDGFSALQAIRNNLPDIVLSDLYMPGMSGFEFLSVIRRRFPTIQVIAMSGVFSGEGIPPGVAADAFFEKSAGLESLLQIVAAMTSTERRPLSTQLSALAPVWIPRNEVDEAGLPYVVVTCPECLRTFTQPLSEVHHSIRITSCVHCGNSISWAIVEPADHPLPQDYQRNPGSGIPTPLCIPNRMPG
jgi:CheY-like chemotaxis protein